MMIIGEGKHSNPTVHIPHILPWNQFDDSPSNVIFPLPISSVSGGGAVADSDGGRGDYSSLLASLQCYQPTNDVDEKSENDISGHECDIPVDAYSCDEFRMYEFKVRRCARGRSHDWTECPYVHSGEKARRRDPRKYHYYGTACPDFRKGNCKRGDSCEFAHGVFECWLHPARYRTQPCKDGTCCRRRVCFFAHTPEQLRVLSQQNPSPSSPLSPELLDGSPFRRSFDSFLAKGSTISSDSPLMSPKSPLLNRTLGSNLINETVTSLRHLQLSKVKLLPSTWGAQMGSGSGFCSPRTPSILRPEFYSMPSTPSTPSRSGPGYFDMWDRNCNLEEEPVMERVESGRDLREKIYEKLTRDNSIDRASMIASPAPDVGRVSELIKRN